MAADVRARPAEALGHLFAGEARFPGKSGQRLAEVTLVRERAERQAVEQAVTDYVKLGAVIVLVAGSCSPLSARDMSGTSRATSGAGPSWVCSMTWSAP
jgi:hypothetical protein